MSVRKYVIEKAAYESMSQYMHIDNNQDTWVMQPAGAMREKKEL